MKTYQDLLKVGDNEKERMQFILNAISEHKSSREYKIAKDAEMYYDGENPDIYKLEKIVYDLQGKAQRDMYSANHKISSSFFGFVVDQEVSYLLGNGIIFGKNDTKKKLGKDFEAKAREVLETGAIEGKCFAFWNYDHMEVFPMVAYENNTGFVPLYDEDDGALKAGIRFWQIDNNKPLRATLYELDGYTEYIKRKDKDIEVLYDKKTYTQIKKKSEVDGEQIFNGENYPNFPIVPFKYNKKGKSKICGKRNTIAALDLVTSNMINNVDEGNLIYWVLTNCGGMSDIDDVKFIERLKTTHVAHAGGDEGAKAEAHSVEAPYAATENAIETLTRKLYTDFQAFDPAALTAGSQTATAILASYVPLDLLVDKTETQFTEFIGKILQLAGIDDEPTYNRNRVINKQEETQTVLLGAEYYDDEYITKKLLTINGDIDVYDELMKRKAAEEIDRYSQVGNENIIDIENNGGAE